MFAITIICLSLVLVPAHAFSLYLPTVDVDGSSVKIKNVYNVAGTGFTISGTLSAGEADLYGPLDLKIGDYVAISVKWTPPSTTLAVILMNLLTGHAYITESATGYILTTFYITESSPYWVLLVADYGPYALTYQGVVVVS